jgi:hypothetical protein
MAGWLDCYQTPSTIDLCFALLFQSFFKFPSQHTSRRYKKVLERHEQDNVCLNENLCMRDKME